MTLLCRNRVQDFSRGKAVLDSHAQAHRNAGLHLKSIWQAIGDPDNVFFLFELAEENKAREFISNPFAAKAAKTSGVLDGEYHFLESTVGY